MIGTKFGTLTVVEELEERNKYRYKQYRCVCDCGKERITTSNNLKNGHTTGCGFHRKKKDNAVKRHELYRVYVGMKTRCYNPNHKHYKHYGGRGIVVCERWLKSFWDFVQDMGKRPEGLTIDRINNDGNYEPNNCKWSSMKEQSNNRRKGNYGEMRREVTS